MRAIGMLDNGFKKNSWVKSAIEYQKRFARDSAKSFSLSVSCVYIFSQFDSPLAFLFVLIKKDK